jgi:hypothetical protein
MELVAPKPFLYQVFWKDWRGEWVTNGTQYKSESGAKRFAATIKKRAENGVYNIQKV